MDERQINTGPVQEDNVEYDLINAFRISMDCRLTMVKYAIKRPRLSMFHKFLGISTIISNTFSQKFRSDSVLTLEFIENADEVTIGRHIKQMHRQLKEKVEEYEKTV